MPGDEVLLQRMAGEICALASRIAAASCQFLELIAAFDRLGGWGSWGCQSMAQWMSWRCGIATGTAREQLRVARALEDLPIIRRHFSQGLLSYSQVRALTKVASPSTDGDLASVARSMTAAQLQRFVVSYRRVRTPNRCADDEYQEARRQARMGMWDYEEDDGTRVIIIRQPPDQAHTLLAAVDRETEREFHDRRRAADSDDSGSRDSYPVRRARALTQLVEHGVSEPRDGDDPLIVLHVDPAVLTSDAPDGVCHFEGGPAVEPETARRLSCGSVSLAASIPAGEQQLTGSRTRRPTPALRRALAKRDPTCVFPGCDARIGIHAHHVVHWSKGGSTTLGNLARLCSFHHHQVHEGGYTMRPAPVQTVGRRRLRNARRWLFVRPDGQVIPPTWPLQPAAGPLQQDVSPTACTTEWEGDRLDNFGLDVLIVHLLTHEELTADPPQEDTG